MIDSELIPTSQPHDPTEWRLMKLGAITKACLRGDSSVSAEHVFQAEQAARGYGADDGEIRTIISTAIAFVRKPDSARARDLHKRFPWTRNPA